MLCAFAQRSKANESQSTSCHSSGHCTTPSLLAVCQQCSCLVGQERCHCRNVSRYSTTAMCPYISIRKWDVNHQCKKSYGFHYGFPRPRWSLSNALRFRALCHFRLSVARPRGSTRPKVWGWAMVATCEGKDDKEKTWSVEQTLLLSWLLRKNFISKSLLKSFELYLFCHLHRPLSLETSSAAPVLLGRCTRTSPGSGLGLCRWEAAQA